MNFRGLFILPREKVPFFVRLLSGSMSTGDLDMRMTSASFSIRKGPLRKISWEERGKGGVHLNLELAMTLPLDGRYLDVGLDQLEAAYRTLASYERSGRKEAEE